MDTRDGKIYGSVREALNAGVPVEALKQTRIHLIDKGPFKGRYYEMLDNGKLGRRVYPTENSSSENSSSENSSSEDSK
jgi:hypothetical protein